MNAFGVVGEAGDEEQKVRSGWSASLYIRGCCSPPRSLLLKMQQLCSQRRATAKLTGPRLGLLSTTRSVVVRSSPHQSGRRGLTTVSGFTAFHNVHEVTSLQAPT